MAEDKRIRVTADVTPLRQLREEAVSLYREIDQAASTNSQNTEKHLQQLREQLSLMEDRNQLEKLLIDLRRQSASMQAPEVQQPISTPLPQQQTQRELKPVYDENANSITWEVNKETEIQPDDEEITKPSEKPKKRRPKRKVEYQEDVEPVIDEETGSVSWNLRQPTRELPIERKPTETIKETQKEILTEINRHVENIDNSVTNVDNSRRTENNSENVTENVKNIERNTETIQENTSVLREKDPVETKSEYQIPPTESPRLRERDDEVVERRETRIIEGQQQFNFDDENIIKAIDGVSGVIYQTSRELGDAIRNLIKGDNKEKKDNSGTNRYLEALTASLSRIEDNVDELRESVVNRNNQNNDNVGGGGSGTNIPPILPSSSEGGAGGLNIISGLGKGLSGLLGGIGTIAFLNQIKNIATERYFRNEEFGLRSEYQGSVETAANYKRVQAANEADMYRWIPIFGNIIARSIEMPANIAADRILQTFSKFAEAENKTIPYAQTFGVSTKDAFGTAKREGRYAADALGMDIGSYLQRRTELTRAAGGRAPGGTEFDVTAERESQSLMAAERLYGIAPSAVNRLQGALRFGDENTSYGGSAIIRAFERSMRELKLPFSEIASTMEESLETFSKRSDEILSKAGEFDAGKVAAVMSSIRTATGAQGRQLERYQSAFLGSGISQDETTQALLLRTLTRTNPNIRTYSEAMEQLEKVQSGNADPEFMRSFLSELQGLSQNNEQFINLLKGVFPNLSWQDIRKQFATGEQPTEVIDRIYNEIQKSFGALKETPRGAYEPTEARQTVGRAERIIATDANKQITQGEKSLGDVCEILDSIKQDTNSINNALINKATTYLTIPGQVIQDTKTLNEAFKQAGESDWDAFMKSLQLAITKGFLNVITAGKKTLPKERD
uniref:Uncharacterized protein n=1 Tax=Herelleviridae sp. cttEB8 TaxID=2825832 RepID=A0A8S5P6S7_9CAUD|nr:MAG TPA: hypothetical protein [Herelleviridae sp. cttEB8]